MLTRWASIIAGALLLPAIVGAQRPDSARASRDTARVAPVVVSATRTPLALDRVPASVTVLDGAALRAQGITHLMDALRLVPGVAVVQAGSYGAQTSLFVRGGQSNYTKVLIDGVAVNAPGGSIDIGTLMLENVERIEILRGPASVVYGSDAVTGVVHIITKRGAVRGASIDARGGTYGNYDVDGSISGGVGAARLSLDLAHHITQGIYDFNSQYRNDVGGGALTVSPWSGGELRATARYADVNAHFPTDFTGAPVDPNAFNTQKRTLIGAELAQRVRSADALLSLTSNVTDGAYIDPPNQPGDFASESRSHVLRQVADLRVAKPLRTVATLTAGGTLEKQHQGGEEAVNRQNSAGYLELLATSGATTATVGARIDHSETYGDFGTYRVSASRALLGAVRVRASLGTAFREPSFVEAFDTPFSVANPDLLPERTTSWEVGGELPFAAQRVFAGVTYFHQRLVDLIDYHFDQNGSQYENIARAKAAGAELQLRTAPVKKVSADASYTWLDTKVERRGFSTSSLATLVEGGPLLRRPRNSGTVGLTYRPNRGMIDVRTTYVGRREDRRFFGPPNFETQAVKLDPYTKVDVGGELPLYAAPKRARVTATLRVENLLGARYESVAGYATPGRVVLAGLRASF
jgi:vitamin B12 transporter